MGVGGGYWLSVCPRAPSVWQGSHGVGGRGQVVSVAQRLDLLSVSLAHCGQHRLAEGGGPAGRTQLLGLLTGAVSKMGRAMWQDVNSHCKPVVCPQGQFREPSCAFQTD